MNIKNQMKISMSLTDIQDAIIKTLYREKGINGIFSVKFNIRQNLMINAEIVVDLNEESK